MGCVCYDPSVGEIWSGIGDYLRSHPHGVKFEYILYDSYEEQVASLVDGQIDVAWNGPVAHVQTELAVATSEPNNNRDKEVVSLGMRDVDRDCESILVTTATSTSKSSQKVDWNKTTLLLGTQDSPQAAIVPYYYLAQECNLQFAAVQYHNEDLGKHGDTALGEIQALEALLLQDNTTHEKPLAAVVSKLMWDRALQGALSTIDPKKLQASCHPVTNIQIPSFDHCQFDAILITNQDDKDDKQKRQALNRFGQALLQMDMQNPTHAPLMKLEGIQKEWKLPRQEGYDIVRKAVLHNMGLTRNAFASHRPATNFIYQNNPQQQQQQRSFSSTTTTTTTANNKQPRVAVVGAGVAGLQAIRALKAQGFQVTAFEAASQVGGLWKSNYDNFGVQVPKQLYEFQDFEMTTVPRGKFATGPQVQEYIQQYATQFGLNECIQFNTQVTQVSQPSNSSNKWKLQTAPTNTTTGSQTEDEFDYLVVATGLYSNRNAFVPSFAGKDNFNGQILHSCEFYNAAIAKDKRVVVIGGGKSAVDCAMEAYKAGASSVTLLQRTSHWPTPRKIAGIIPFQYIFLSRLGTALVSSHRGTYPNGSGKIVNAVRNSVIGPLLMRPVFGIVEELFAFQFGLTGERRPKTDVVTDFYDCALVLDAAEFKNMTKQGSGKINAQLGEIESCDKDGSSILLKDGSTLSADLLVSATGFSQDYSLFTDKTLEQLDLNHDGMYLYRHILPPKIPNLAFIGHMAAISNMSSYGLQAEWLTRYWAGNLPPPMITTSEQMYEAINAQKEWARSWIPDTNIRGMTVLLHQTHYHDQLLRDMGINPHRKSNHLSEYFMPYEPADYNGIMGGSSPFLGQHLVVEK